MMWNRNLHVVAVLAAMMTLGVQASLVSSNEVIGAVSAWTSANGAAVAETGWPVDATPAYGDDGETVLYWMVRMSGGGAVVASPDTDLDLVIAVLEKYDGELPPGHPLPTILKKDMTKRLAAIARRNAAASGVRRKAGAAAAAQAVSPELDIEVAKANAQWAKYGVGAAGGGMRLLGDTLDDGDESPYVRRVVDGFEAGGRYTHWNQSAVGGHYCYNKYTPNHAVCGCVATAGSAILQFFNCTNDIGVVVGNPTYDKDFKPAANYRNDYGPCDRTIAGALDWSILPAKSYGGAKEGTDVLDDAGRDLLGRVAFNMGVLVNMMWDIKGQGTESGSFVPDLVNAFKAYGFKTARCVYYSSKKDTDGVEFFKTIYAQVWCGAPVVLGISSAGGGHAVVGCGYARDPDGDEFCRVFMGWGGSGDAWYKFPKIQDFETVDEAVTMIGYQDDAVVPVYGEANIPGVDLVLPGYVTNGVPVTVPVNENGFFGIRVPTDISDKRVVYEPRNRSADIDPFDGDVLSNESAELEDLDAALPDEIFFSILNATVKSTMASAKAVAERDGKALLMVSGMPGTPRTKALMEYLYWLDDTTDFSNKFVLVFNNVKSSDANRPDGNPGIGVFDPVDFVVSERWQELNERLAYDAFIDADATAETNEVVYTFSETNTVVMTNGVDAVLAVGYDAYLRQHSGITVTITGVNGDSGTNAPFEVSTVVPEYGIRTDLWTNGEYAVFSAPGVITNETEGTIMSCVGWTTDEPFAPVPMMEEWALQPYNSGNTAEIQLLEGDEITLTWIWKITHYRVTASSTLPYTVEGATDAVTPAETWVKAGDRVTISAQAEVGHRFLSGWEVSGSSGDYDNSSDAALSENGTTISFVVNEPVTVKANYSGRSAPEEPVSYTLTLVSEPQELEAATPPVRGDFAWGENTTLDNTFMICQDGDERLTYTDSTGGVWVCTSYAFSPAVWQTDSRTFQLLSTSTTVTFTWELVVPEEPDPPDPPDTPTPGPITISSLVQESDGSWTVTVSGAVKDCWYWLYSTDDLANFSGDEAAWTAATDLVEKKQASDDGDIVFSASGSGDALFWRARATSTEDGD